MIELNVDVSFVTKGKLENQPSTTFEIYPGNSYIYGCEFCDYKATEKISFQ